ncbi:MAG: nucleotidyltransferase domain-containing protein [Solirubrobacteraceae bacterium]
MILFGSRARGDGDDRSDFDFLVIEREVGDRFDEMVRLDRVLGRMLIPADVVVISEQYAQKWGSVRGTMGLGRSVPPWNASTTTTGSSLREPALRDCARGNRIPMSSKARAITRRRLRSR